jgi:hypothetical protein
MEEDDIILSYRGVLTLSVLNSLLEIIEAKIKALSVGVNKERRAVRILVECFQNLYHHLDAAVNSENKNNDVLIVVRRRGEGFTIRTGNLVSKEDIPNLKRRLAMVNALDTEELRELYRLKLKNDERTVKGTAGLGLIDIARKSKNKLGYEISNVNDEFAFFCLNVEIE